MCVIYAYKHSKHFINLVYSVSTVDKHPEIFWQKCALKYQQLHVT